MMMPLKSGYFSRCPDLERLLGLLESRHQDEATGKHPFPCEIPWLSDTTIQHSCYNDVDVICCLQWLLVSSI